MSCCEPPVALTISDAGVAREEILLASANLGGDLRQTDVSVPDIHCGGCIQAIESALARVPGVQRARVNLSMKRVCVQWDGPDPPPIFETLGNIGYQGHLFDPDTDGKDAVLAQLLRALAVAGFAASNIMLLSVSVWLGAGPETRSLFHWLSALIAFPVLAYSGQVFFRSAWRALRHGTTNMDVPISIGVLLAFGMSLYETIHHGAHAYFDAAVSLVFFLLIGRTLDYMMRERARQAVKGLARLSARGSLVLHDDGTRTYVPIGEIAPGMTLLLAAGERVPVDARVVRGASDIDCSLVTGESLSKPAVAGDALQAGTLNLTGPLTISVTAAAKDSFLAEMVRMMEAAEAGRSAYRRIADRAARLYAPVVHLAALLSLIGWVVATGDWHRAIMIAVAVLIITCPCALGLAVPMVQVIAARRLFEQGVMLKDGGALERLAEIDSAIFDKTGTLTRGEPRLVSSTDPAMLERAAAIAAHSRHPYSRALAAAFEGRLSSSFMPDSVSEHPGFGLEARVAGANYRLGRADWALAGPIPTQVAEADLVLGREGSLLATFRFEDRLRAKAHKAVDELLGQGIGVEILSGDRDEPVRKLAAAFGVSYIAGVSPAEKLARIADLTASGKKVLMVGDGLNDAPALAAAHASMAPASAADVGRNAADLVFLRERLDVVPQAIGIARRARDLVRQNFILAVGYNVIAVPLAVAGYVTPLVAAISMSLSSIVVVANSQRLTGRETIGNDAPVPGVGKRLATESGR